LYNTGEALTPFEYKSLENNEFGRFGVSKNSVFNEIKIGREYFVMGIIVFETYQAYLIDDNGFITTCPCQLFEIIDNRLNSEWHFRTISNKESIYPFVQAVFGYYELCCENNSYENLIVDKMNEAQRTYFRRKTDLEKELEIE
jgi:hypothetical protein